MPGKVQMPMPQPHELHHTDIDADAKVRLSWKGGRAMAVWPVKQLRTT